MTYAAHRLRPRLLLRSSAAGAARQIAGAWWPRTATPAAELPELISAVAARIGATQRIAFSWHGPARRQHNIAVGEDAAWNGPLPDQLPDVVHLFGTDGQRLALTVVAPGTGQRQAEKLMRHAAGIPRAHVPQMRVPVCS
jgi:hypothetical protein